MGSAGKKLRTRMDIGKDIQNCLDDLNNMTHAKLAELWMKFFPIWMKI